MGRGRGSEAVRERGRERGMHRGRQRARERERLSVAGARESGLVIFDYRWFRSVSHDGDKCIDLLSVTTVPEVEGMRMCTTRCPLYYKGQIRTGCSIDLLRGRYISIET